MNYTLVVIGLAVIEAAILTAAVLLLRRVGMSGRPVRRVTIEYEDGTVQVYHP